MESASNSNDVTAQMGQLTLQTDVANTNGKVTPSSTTPNTNSGSTSRPRTGIPRYAIPYRRPDDRPSGNGSAQSPTSPAISETAASNCQPSAIPRSRNGIRTESLGDESVSSGFGASASQRYSRAASVGEWKCF